jgi:hypothetical protein
MLLRVLKKKLFLEVFPDQSNHRSCSSERPMRLGAMLGAAAGAERDMETETAMTGELIPRIVTGRKDDSNMVIDGGRTPKIETGRKDDINMVVDGRRIVLSRRYL